MKRLYAADLFCGAGGTSTGLAQACREVGVQVDLLAINHWQIAIDTHTASHPWARHMCAPIKPRGEVYSRDLTEAGYKTFSELQWEAGKQQGEVSA